MAHTSIVRIVIPLLLPLLAHPVFADEPPAAKPTEAKTPEFVEMFDSILLHGADMGPYSGWFHPSQTRYGWNWLADHFDRDHNGVLTPNELKGSASLFRSLDRDQNETITRDDLDWSPRSSFLQSRAQGRQRFGQMDRDGNGRITPEEWAKAFEQAARGKKFLSQDDLAELLYPPPAPPSRAPSNAPRGPSRLTLLKGLFSGEIGSYTEGPGLNQQAPDFTLETHDKSKQISLSDYRGKKPVVLIFGSFT